jgi:hypothetical protein
MMKAKSDLLILRLAAVLLGSTLIMTVNGQMLPQPETVPSSAKADVQAGNNDNIFVVYSTSEDKQEFREYAEQMARLKKFGRVDICINSPALKSDFELPVKSCDWHEYASYNRSVEAFFPDSMLAPFVPAEYISKNRQMLLYRTGVLRELGLNAAFRSNEPRFLPTAFFDKYPHLRGPRVDHPRRSVQKEFSPCFHQPETMRMYRNMLSQLFKNVPEIRTFYFSMNDAGSGSCWCDWLYSGPNGPSFCRNIDKSTGIVAMLNIYREEAKLTAGHDVDIYFKGMFTEAEKDDLAGKLPENCFLDGRNYPPVKNIYSMLDEIYPVRGIINPVQIIRTMSHKNVLPQRYIFDFWASYSRAHERVETIEKVVDLVSENIINPPGEGELNVLQALQKICTKWAGTEYTDRLFNAFLDLDRVVNENAASLRGLSTLYWGVSARQITRPLVFAPKMLSPAEEKYFLPYIFNVSIDEARNDYLDIHGGDRVLPVNAVDNLLSGLRKVCKSMDAIRNAPEQKFIEDMAKALRLYSCVIRTCGNFNEAQIIRNRNIETLAGPVHRPDKTPTWTGDQDLLDFNAVMRDELDNIQEMIDLLESGGMDLICIAKPPFPEDTFVLGPDIIDQLKQKRKIMLDHWTDIEDYLSTPFK